MLKFTHLSLRRGTLELLHDVSCIINPGQKVGVTGANGVGKSSLFALVRGELQPDAGEFQRPPGWVIAHVAQETPAVDQPAIEYVIDGDEQLRAVEAAIDKANQAGDGDQLAELYAELEAINGYTARSRAGKLMHGLGFRAGQESLPVADFSGGWRMRLNLARALMCRSDLLLLDEPTNHLDLEAVIWLEEWLQSYPGTLLLISHDRDFLDRVVTQVAHIEQGSLALYTGNYTAFELHRAQQLANQQAAWEKQQREIAHIKSYVDRFRAKATKARQAQSRLKALERMELISQAHVDSPFNFTFSSPEQLPQTLVELEKVSVGYGETHILDAVDLFISAGDRIGLLGHNGAGKSTLIKLLAGELPVQAGQVKAAQGTCIGYFAQHQLEQLDPEASPLLHLQRLDASATEPLLRKFLGGFGFSDDKALTPIATFSGGEKARLVLALIVYQRPNLLLLDEPTNHLDIEMRHALSVALQDFAGAMIIVSHDRHLLRTVTDQLLLVDGGRVQPFDGDLDDYRRWVREQEVISGKTDSRDQPASAGPAVDRKQLRRDAAEQRRRLQPLRRELERLEKKLEALTDEQASIQEQLADTALYEDKARDRLQQLMSEQARNRHQLQEVEQQWLEKGEALENMKQES
jgi:ATP-binding cassette subfamily F protein 3